MLISGQTWSRSENTMTFIASSPAVELLLDPFVTQLAGCGAAMLLLLAASMGPLPEGLVVEALAGGALVLFAAVSWRRAYRHFWAPALLLLALVGVTGIMLSLLPAAGAEVSTASLMRFGLEGLRHAAQLGAVAMTAYAWSTAGRSPARMNRSLLVVAALALLQLGEAGHGALIGAAVPIWQLAIDGVFAIWLWATAIGMAYRQRDA